MNSAPVDRTSKRDSSGDSALVKKEEESISRTLISDNFGREGLKRSSTDGAISSRSKKKKNGQLSAVDLQSNSFLQSIVPKLGPAYRIKPSDSEQFKKALDGITARKNASIESGLNFLLAWSAADKLTFQTEIPDVISLLSDFVMKSLSKRTDTAAALFETSQYRSLASDGSMHCAAVGTILKNISINAERPLALETSRSALLEMVTCVLNNKALNEMERGEFDPQSLLHSTVRDFVVCLKMVDSLEGFEEAFVLGIDLTLQNCSLPLRLRIACLDLISSLVYEGSIKPVISDWLENKSKDFLRLLKLFLVYPDSKAVAEAEAEFKGIMDFDGLAVFQDEKGDVSTKDDIQIWKWKLQTEAMLSATTFLNSISSTAAFKHFISDHFILQCLTHLTTGKTFSDMSAEGKLFTESKLAVMVNARRNIRSSEMQSYRIILDVLQEDPASIKDKLLKFEDQFVVSAFDASWQAKQCAVILSILTGAAETADQPT